MLRCARVLLALLFVLPLAAAEVGPRYLANGVHQRVAAAPSFAALRGATLVTLEGEAFVPHRAGRREIVGTTRELPPLDFPGTRTSALEPITAAFRSAGAGRVRLRLTNLSIGNETLWVYGAKGTAPVAFGKELLGGDGTLWTPSVPGDTIYLEAPPHVRFRADALAHIARLPEATSTACFTDVSCNAFDEREALSKAVAQLLFLSPDGWAVCTGGLINAKDKDDTLLLTANHCINTAAAASSLEATWDDRTASCGGTVPAVTPTTHGATLLATSAATDVTLLRMTSLPSGRWLMGWTTTPPSAGTMLYRISHPAGSDSIFPQTYSTTTVDVTVGTCTGIGRPQFLYSRRATGGIGGGSSGSPVIVAGGYIVGQLYGVCGETSTDGCANDTYTVDGALARSYAVLQLYLNPSPTSCSACVPNATTACLLGNRFKVTMKWVDPVFGNGTGKPIHFAENGPQIHPDFGPIIESTYFAFYDFFPNSVESIVKMTKGVGINSKYWVFVTGFTGATYDVTVQDTQTCTTWQRSIAANATSVLRDYEAFPFP